jgi:hypothetical protein
MTENPPRKHGKKLEKLEPWIRQLKNKIGFYLQESKQLGCTISFRQQPNRVR